MVKTTLTRRPMPVPPVYQPEVAARAIVWSAEHPQRREVYVGGPTPLTIWSGRLLPGLVDRYLAATNYEAQQTDEAIDPERRSYLWEPVPGDSGAHGGFDHIAHARSLQFAVASQRRVLAAGATGLAAAALTRRGRRRRRVL